MENQTEQSITSFDDLIDQINNTAGDVQRERGTLFERLVLAYLKNEPIYKNLYKHVWMLNNVPEQYGIPKRDTGVDLVAEQYDGTLTAVQVKFYKEGTRVGKSEIDSFVAELGKDYYQHGLIVSSTDNWNRDARKTVDYNSKGIGVIGISDLRNSKIDWHQFNFKRSNSVSLKEPKHPRPYQNEAIDNAIKYYRDNDRGMMIMAPGTGKTYTSLKITEKMTESKRGQFRVLYLVPSIQLLTQSLRGWNNDTELTITNMAVTSDRNASRNHSENEEIKGEDIGYPATTSTDQLIRNYNQIKRNEEKTDLMVVFSTYQSIDVIGKAQNNGFPEFDLIVADEAHRTTGEKVMGPNSGYFMKVHSNTNVKGIKRLYQTATPKIYGESAKKKAKEKSVELSSMDKPEIFGHVFYRLGFGDAVKQSILTDYKVMVLAISEDSVKTDMQKTLSDANNGLKIGDVGKIIGIWNGMMRRNNYKNPKKYSEYDGAPLERAIAFTRTIADSKRVANKFETVVNEYLEDSDEQQVHVSVKHADGTMNALEKGDILDWLSSPNKPSDEARIVSNARFLTEGVDIPSLDAVIFLAPKKSQIDIVQAVGRIMRKAPGKDYGYVILPIVIPSGETPENILDNDHDYDVVWQVINALRSVDERFVAMIDKLQFGGKSPIDLVTPHGAPNKMNGIDGKNDTNINEEISQQTELDLSNDEFKKAIYGKIVQRVGDKRYLDHWTGDVAKIAQRQITWINNKLSDKNDPIQPKFKQFLNSLKHNINNDITEEQASEMISQHLITKPIFDALFNDYDFVNSNPVSMAMEKMIKILEDYGFAKEQATLKPLYDDIRERAEGITEPKHKQEYIVTLYNRFFNTAFNDTTKKLGIVFTPIEIVDFIVHSVDKVLNKYFGESLSEHNINVLDPFTGTGTFIVRTLTYLKEQLDSGKISLADITRKYTQELYANEIVLLSYYIAAINIESTFADISNEKGEYRPFNGIVLTDTFESTEKTDTLDDSYFGSNDVRLANEQKSPITAIISNPPYSAKQDNEDNNRPRGAYPLLDNSIKKSWSDTSNATNKNGLTDSYLRALRWSIDRIGDKGVIGFITNNSFIDGYSMDGMRKSLLKEFSHVYIVNLKGSLRQKDDKQTKYEGGNVFNIQTSVAITILVKENNNTLENGKLHYLDIGYNLSADEKINQLVQWDNIMDIEDKFDTITPNSKGDWINQRNSNFDEFVKIGDKKSDDALFIDYSGGLKTGRDAWSTGFSKKDVINHVTDSIDFYNENIGDTSIYDKKNSKISWTASLKTKFKNKKVQKLHGDRIYLEMYRPFTKKYVYYSQDWVDRQYQMQKIFPNTESRNLLISMSNKTSGKRLTSLMTDVITDVNLFSGGSQNFPRYLYDNFGEYTSMRDSKLNEFKISDDDMFYYIYGLLHSPGYNEKYSKDLAKSLPRIPNVKHKERYVDIGKKLTKLHLDYENQSKLPDIKVDKDNGFDYKIKDKMKHPGVKNKNGKTNKDLTTIKFNEYITIRNIPLRAYDYIVNGKSAIKWIMNQYQISFDADSGFTDDPNEFSDDPKYIFNLLLSVITVSMKTLELVDQLPKFEVIEEDN